MAAHRYWRINILKGWDTTYIGYAEVEFRDTVGGADLTGSGTPMGTEWTSVPSEYPQYAYDNVTTTRWQFHRSVSQTSGSQATGWIGYDFGAGNEKDIIEVNVRNLHDTGGRNLRFALVEYSDDGTTWEPYWAIIENTSLGAGVAKTYTRPADSDAFTRWGMLCNKVIGAGTFPFSSTELIFRDSLGTDLAVGGTASSPTGNTAGSPASLAFDRNTATFFIGPQAVGAPMALLYQHTAAVTPVEYSFRARNDSFGPNESPKDWYIISSDNGVEWLVKDVRKDEPSWTAGELRTYDIASTPEGITSVTPSVGDEAGGTSVTITGFGFTSATDVTFGGSSADNIVVVDNTTITCDTPSGTGVVDVVVVRPTTNLTLTNGFEYVVPNPPTIVSISPVEGPVDTSTVVTLTGTDLTGTTDVLVNGSSVSFTVDSSTTITFTAPASLVAGPVDVVVEHPFGDATLVDGFEYINVVHVTQVPLLVINKPVQGIRVTQVPLLVVSLPIQDTRVTQVPILPVWTPKPIPLPSPVVPEVPVKEVWQWKTVVNIFEASKEQRSALRGHPRMSMQFNTHVLNSEYHDVYQMLLKYVSRVFNYPMYTYSAKLSAAASAGATKLYFDPSHTDLRDGEIAALFDPLLEKTIYVSVSTVDADGATLSEGLSSDAPVYFYICPAPQFRVSLPQMGMASMSGSLKLDLVGAQVRDVLRPDQSTSVTTLNGMVLIDERPLADGENSESFNQNMVWLDNHIADPEPKTSWYAPLISTEKNFLVHRPFGLDKWRAIASNLKGRQTPFLMPSFRNDLPVSEQPALSATEIKSDSIQFFDIWRSKAWKRVRIQSDAGVIYRTINEVVANYDSSGEPVSITIKLSSSIGATTGSNTNMVVSFVNTFRLDSDEIVVEHFEVDSIVSFKVRMVEE